MIKILLLLATLMLLFSCDEADIQKEKVIETIDTNSIPTFEPPTFEQAFLEQVYQTQMDVMQNPSSRTHREKYISEAYIEDANTLISFGNARLSDPKTGNKIATPLIKRAALLDAKRWASYGLLWIDNDFKSDFGNIKDVHKGLIKEIATFNRGDSLILAIASKVK
jgi:hypothetical protein